LNEQIDRILSGGYELDSLEPNFCGKMELLLRQRRAVLFAEHDYQKVAQIDRNLEILSEVRSKYGKLATDTDRLREMIECFQSSLDSVEKERKERRAAYEEKRRHLEEEQRNAQEALNSRWEEDLGVLADELDDIEMGIMFHASARLRDLRASETSLAKASCFADSIAARKAADELEVIERKAFDAEMRRAHAARRRAVEEDHTARVAGNEAFFKDKLAALDSAYAREDASAEREAGRYRKRIAELEEKIANSPELGEEVTTPRRSKRVQRKQQTAVATQESPPASPVEVESNVYEEEGAGTPQEADEEGDPEKATEEGDVLPGGKSSGEPDALTGPEPKGSGNEEPEAPSEPEPKQKRTQNRRKRK
jgi:tetratricopeptide (TPR) repeat protein